ncbi:MAG: hypothetical protein ACK4HI_05700 [Limnobacter sp.]
MRHHSLRPKQGFSIRLDASGLGHAKRHGVFASIAYSNRPSLRIRRETLQSRVKRTVPQAKPGHRSHLHTP